MDKNAILNQAGAYARGGIYFAAGWTVGYGVMSGETALQIAGAFVTLLPLVWSGFANTNAAVVAAAAKVPEVVELHSTDPKLAEVAKQADPTTKVVVTSGGTK